MFLIQLSRFSLLLRTYRLRVLLVTALMLVAVIDDCVLANVSSSDAPYDKVDILNLEPKTIRISDKSGNVAFGLPSTFSYIVKHSKPHQVGAVTQDIVQHTIDLLGNYCSGDCANPLHVDHIVLENQYLRIEVVPQLGGRVRSVVYKPALLGSDSAPRKNTQMFALDTHGTPHDKLQVYVPWNYGGWRVSFPFFEHGLHGENQATSYRLRTLANGTAVLTMTMYFDRFSNEPKPANPDDNFAELGRYGRYSPLTLVQEIQLAPGQASFQTRFTVFNPLPYRYGFKLWNTAALPRTEDARFVFPVSRMAFHWWNQAFRNWPLMDDGKNGAVVDRSVFANWTTHPSPNGKSYFGLDVTHPYAAIYYPSDDVNRLRITEPSVAPGLKLYSFNWNRGWLDSFELWGGSTEIFEDKGHFLEPFNRYSYKVEWWMPQNIGKLTAASAAIAAGLTYEEVNGQMYTRIRLTASRTYSDLVVFVANGTESGKVKLDSLNPETVVLFSIPVARHGSPVWVKIHDGDNEIFNYQLPVELPPVDKAAEACRKELNFTVPQDNDSCSEAVKKLLTGYRRAEYSEVSGEGYWNPGDCKTLNTFGRLEAEKIAAAPKATAHERLIYGRILYRLGGKSYFDVAHKQLMAATTADPSLGEAWLLLGTLEMETGNTSAATIAWKNALNAANPASLANYFLALNAISGGNLPAAQEFIDALLMAQPDNYFARLLKAGILERRKQYQEALDILDKLEEIHASDPGLVYLKQLVYTGLDETLKAAEMRQVLTRIEAPLRGDPLAAKRRQEFVNQLTTGDWKLPLRPPHLTSCNLTLPGRSQLEDRWTNDLIPLE